MLLLIRKLPEERSPSMPAHDESHTRAAVAILMFVLSTVSYFEYIFFY